MKFLIQHNLMNLDQLNAIREVLEPYPKQYVGVIPFSRELTSEEPVVGQNYIPYGSTLMSTLGLELGWRGLAFDLENFSYNKAVLNRKDMLNDGLLLRAAEAIKILQNSTHKEWFIRPSLDLKQFAGQIINSKEGAEWLSSAIECDSSSALGMDKDTQIVLSRPQNIQAEWRWFIVDGKIVDGAMYRHLGQLVKKHETDQDVIDEAQKFADGWLPHKNVVMDLSLVDGELKVIEFNCINCSGFYGHDIGKIFNALFWNSLTLD